MIRVTLVLAMALAATPLWGDQDRPRIDRARLEWFKKLTPEQKKLLRERLEKFRKLPKEEQQRLLENARKWRELPEDMRRQIQDRMQQLTPEEKERYANLSQIYFRHMGRQGLKAFPREPFFVWLKNNRPTAIERMAYLEGPARAEHFTTLCAEFKQASLERVEMHLRIQKCVPLERLEEVRKADPTEFWAKFQALMQECRQKHPQRRPLDIRDKRPLPPKK